ncbi:hypothetical protein GCM10023219_00430 [Stakelama sediminis]|nr:hypothetical protein [Stakelama sediminis]
MIDNFALGLTHALLLLIIWRLLFRRDLDQETPETRIRDNKSAKSDDEPAAPRGWRRPRA